MRPHQSNDKVQNLECKLSNVVKIRCKHLLTIPSEGLQRWRDILVVARLFELAKGKKSGEKDKGSL